MKHFVPILFVAWALTCAGQTEHWRFRDSLASGDVIHYEIYTAPGKYVSEARSTTGYAKTIVDSAIRQRLDLYEVNGAKVYLRSTIEAPLSATLGARASDEEIGNMEEMEEMRPQPGREGLDFRLLPETKKQFGLTLQRAELFMADPKNDQHRVPLGSGWMLAGKTLPTMQCQLLSDGRSALLVEFQLHNGSEVHHQQLVGYSSGKAAPQGTFSLSIPAGYEDIQATMKTDPVTSEPVKSIIIGD